MGSRTYIWLAVGISLLVITSQAQAQGKREAVSFSPMEISVELSRKEMQTSAGRSSNKIFVLDTWDERLEISDIQTSANVVPIVYDMTYRWPSGATTHAFRVETRLKDVNKVDVLNEWVKLSTNHPDFTTISIPITYHICSSLQVAPKTLIFNNFVEQHLAKTIRVKSLEKSNLEIEQIRVYDPWLSVKQTRIDPNIIDLKVSIPEQGESIRDILKSAIAIKTTKPEEGEKTVEVIVLSRVAYDDQRILSIIAMSNRLNKQILNSFNCEYTSTYQLSGGMERKQIGRYAFSGEREYHRKDNVGTSKDYLHYVRNGIHVRSTGSPRFIKFGTQGKARIRPPSPDPWAVAGGTGAGVIPELDRLNPKYDKVASVEETLSDGRRYVIVGIEQHFATTPGDGCDNILTIHFSVEDGFMPVRVKSKTPKKSDQNKSFSYNAMVTKILEYQIQDSTLYLPVEFHQETYRGGKLHRTRHYRIDEESVEVNPDLPDELFRIDIQPGDLVIDKDLDMQLTNLSGLDLFGSKVSFESTIGGSDLPGAGGGYMDVEVTFGQELVQTWGISLAGKSLPDWKGIKLELKESQTKDKVMLICFFDMEQRPSRNCMRELAKRAQKLKEKAVTVVAVQASKVHENALNEWGKTNNIPFTVGMIQGDEEKTLFTWGVRSLPWLILTDKEHIIRAEGVAMSELDEKLIKTIGE